MIMPYLTLLTIAIMAVFSCSCSERSVSAKESDSSQQQAGGPVVGVVKVVRTTLRRNLTVSSELVPFQQIDVYAKESGFVRKLNVDFGTHVKAGDVMATLEIPELEAQLEEDQADIKDASDQVGRYQNDLQRVEAQRKVTHLQYVRINQVAKVKAGLVAQQEVDDWEGKDLAMESQVAAARSTLQSAQSQLDHAKARSASRSGAVRLFPDHGPVYRSGHAALRESGNSYAVGNQ